MIEIMETSKGLAMSRIAKWKSLSLCAVSDGIPRRSFYAALVVGTILNVINQGDALLGSAPVNWFKIVLTYCVPYVVCTYGAVSSQARLPATGVAKET
jgi:hypothetical protein